MSCRVCEERLRRINELEAELDTEQRRYRQLLGKYDRERELATKAENRVQELEQLQRERGDV